MLTIAIFTYKRLIGLNKCIQSIDSKNVNEILIFNDNEKEQIQLNSLSLNDRQKKIIHIYNPSDFDFDGRNFRKPIYINKAIEFSKNEQILFSDDDGIFQKGVVDMHFNALRKYPFTAGSIIRSKIFNKVSKSILQGTNYAFKKDFFYKVGGYDEKFVESMGGGDVDFWYRIYHYTQKNDISVAFMPQAVQNVASKSKREKRKAVLDPKQYTSEKHNLNLQGQMYTWFKEIRNKYNWMEIIN
tara:strand:+ start:877 stop:1602 length:726 start_codon:yes stop_codon:yes gene_type:complete